MSRVISARAILSILTVLSPCSAFPETDSPAAQVQWTSCAGPADSYQDCTVPTEPVETIRVGIEGNHVFRSTQDVESVPCNGFLGGPAPYAAKSCAYTTSDIFGLATAGRCVGKAMSTHARDSVSVEPMNLPETPGKLMDMRRLAETSLQPRIALEDGISRTYAWLLENSERFRT